MTEEKVNQVALAEEENQTNRTVAEEEQTVDSDNWWKDEETDADGDEDPEKALLELEEQREELRRLHQAGMLSDKKLAFHESQLDQGVQFYEYQLEQAVQSITASEEQKEKGKRSNVITVRLDDETLQCLDELVSASVAQSRSQAASMLINEGINAKSALFHEIRKHIEEISNSRQRLQQTILESGFGKVVK
jgi:predicted transcriptional regulator